MNSSWNTHSNAQSANANRNINQQKKPQKKEPFVLKPRRRRFNHLFCLFYISTTDSYAIIYGWYRTRIILDVSITLQTVPERERDTTQHQSKVEQFFPLMPFGIKWAEYQHPIAASSSYHIMLQKKWEINNFMEFWAAAALQGNKKR